MSGVLSGKGAVVTGGSRGIGAAIVRRLAADGAAVVFNFARSPDQAAQVAKDVRDAGGRAWPVRADLGVPGAVDELMAAAGQHLDGLDILVNNAALEFASAPIADTSEEVFDAVMTVNARATFLAIRHAARSMRDDGRIISISTLNTTRPAPGIAPYVASKGAVEQLTQVAAVELGARGITVNAVCPGATDTDMLRNANPPEALAQLPALTPLGRLGQPADIADVVALLASPDGRWLTGQIIHATGGLG
jgi:3-oxoacyl-[acyl-carrier protein] reductase